MLLPLTEIDVLELPFDDAAHFLGVLDRNATGKVCQRHRPGLRRHANGEFDVSVLGDSLRPLKWSEHTVFVDGF